MKEEELKAFVKVVTEYFRGITGMAAELFPPFIKDETTEFFNYTGIIGISGSRRGGVYYTASTVLLENFAFYILGPGDYGEDALYDLVGEMTNTIAGNIRETFGSSFQISVPIVMKGQIDNLSLKLRPPVFIMPIEWNGHKSHLGIGLE